jgi:hypothetical protein
LAGTPRLWPDNRLIPKERNIFYAEGWPFEFTFDVDDRCIPPFRLPDTCSSERAFG